jgi:sterol desaturase/sphingolipid hydroxylase (fatty acid hydroxylase superfamily)
MDALIREHAWFLAFWSMIVLFGAIEFLFPQFPESADRARRWPTNFGLGILSSLIISSLPVVTVGSAQWAAEHGIGLLNWIAAPWWVALACTLLIRSFSQYAFHLICHKNPLLWRLHRVHHCDVHLDVTSALRTHPLELIASVAFMSLVALIFGLSPVVLAIFEGVEAVFTMLTHVNTRIPALVERYARSLLVTPSLHRLHHSTFQAETDSNYGNVFSFWDRLFGTYRGETIQSDEKFRFGLDDVSLEHAGNFHSQLKLPWAEPDTRRRTA